MSVSPRTSLREEVAGAEWYHSMRLPGGIVTPGIFNTIDELPRVPLPASLAGKRCLDVGTADGFWAFEMERRGATDVVAIDVRDPAKLDWPGPPKSEARMRQVGGAELVKHRGFEIAHRAYGSSVQWRESPVYALTPDLVGEFDFVFVGSLLLHLRDPVGALAAIRTVLRGEMLSVDTVSPLLTLFHPRKPLARFEAPGWPLWWALNLAAYRRLFDAAGLEIVQSGRPFFVKPGPSFGTSPRAGRSPDGIMHRISAELGILHAWVRVRPGAHDG
jgi:tRNA (mo5U34)-methyltransferase